MGRGCERLTCYGGWQWNDDSVTAPNGQIGNRRDIDVISEYKDHRKKQKVGPSRQRGAKERQKAWNGWKLQPLSGEITIALTIF